jgi:hypothetical protein
VTNNEDAGYMKFQGNRKWIHAAVICGFGLLAVTGVQAAEEPDLQLKGILATPSNTVALLEGGSNAAQPQTYILSRGQRQGDVEILDIDARSAKVSASVGGRAVGLQFAGTSAPSASNDESPSLRLEQAGLNQVLTLYQGLTARSVLRSSSLPDCKLDLDARSTDLSKSIEAALREKGIHIQFDGDKFAIVEKDFDLKKVPLDLEQAARELSKPYSSATQDQNTLTTGPSEELLPAGVINFPATDINQVLSVFAELAGRTVLRPLTLPAPAIIFKNQTPLTRRELIYALVFVFALNGVSVQPVDDKFVAVFATPEREKVASVLSRKMVARAIPGDLIPAGTGMEVQPIGSATIAYQKLCGQSVEVEEDLMNRFIPFTAHTPLTPAEMLRGLDVALGLQSLEVVEREDGKGLKLLRR